ncbi:MAG: tetratricopeptide repeat protein [Rhodospirillaceae bacterium]|nr:MAG: tetratricopeptide repeat protein [Rhodospirillaceae bacterium]
MTTPESIMKELEAGLAALEAGRLDAAERRLTAILATSPDDVNALHLLGLVRLHQGMTPEAAHLITRAVDLHPAFAAAWANLGNALLALGDGPAAIQAYERAEALAPGAEVAFNLGNALMATGREPDAVAAYRRALAHKPDYIAAWNNLGLALQRVREMDGAVDAFGRALALNADDVAALVNLGNLLQLNGRLDEAIIYYARAVDLEPARREGHVNLGMALHARGRTSEAITAYRRALEINPRDADLLINLGQVLRAERQWNEAVAAYGAALGLKAVHDESLSHYVHLSRQVCRWDGLDAYEARLVARARMPDFRGQPFPLLAVIDDPAVHLAAARHYARNTIPPVTPMNPGSRPPTRRRLRVAYLSADFAQHATTCLAAGLFEKHDKSRFEITALSFGPDDKSGMRPRLVAAFDRFIDVRGLSDTEAARTLRDLEIDIAVDLKGYTAGHRAAILSHRPAPVQVSYLGYPGTMGVGFIDYIVVDRFVVPAVEQPFYDEKLVHLPGCYQVNDSRRAMGKIPTRTECGLPEKGFVFCSFNNTYKITPQIFDVWMRLLRAVPRSVLWLMGDNIWTPENLRREARARGVDPRSLVFADRIGVAAHLARHACADLFLDTNPCAAHTTASEALWAGLPLVTLAGRSFVSRVAGSLLQALGLPELVTTDIAAYEQLALYLATSSERLADLRRRLGEARDRSPVFDTEQFCRHLEAAYLRMWERHQQGLAPASFAVDAG